MVSRGASVEWSVVTIHHSFYLYGWFPPSTSKSMAVRMAVTNNTSDDENCVTNGLEILRVQ